MKIGILQCDHVREELQSEFGDYPQMITALFANVAPDYQFRLYDVQAFEYPQHLDECDAYISTGSRHSVYDDLPWIARLEDFIRELDQARKKYFGICFGHQLMIQALGGEVRKSDRGWGIGVTSNHVEHIKPWMEPIKAELNLIASHQDQVISLPQDVEIDVLAGSTFCPCYMLAYGDHFLSVQGHPEFCKDYSSALMDIRRNIIPAERIEQGKASLTTGLDDQLFARWIVNFINA
ncbi:MAG: GMP synthase [Burkholderiales bacterium]|nr:GMP synthase [Burkholderiales bacterium]